MGPAATGSCAISSAGFPLANTLLNILCTCPDRSNTPVDVFNVMGALFLCITFLGTYNASGVLPVLSIERPVFYRERAAGMYAALPYAVAQVRGEPPRVCVCVLCVAWLGTFPPGHFGLPVLVGSASLVGWGAGAAGPLCGGHNMEL